MADLYNLDAELEDLSSQEGVDDGVEPQEIVNNDNDEEGNDEDDWQATTDAYDLELPVVLREAAAARNNILPEADEIDDAPSQEDEDWDGSVGAFAAKSSYVGATTATTGKGRMQQQHEQLKDLPYTRLYEAWSQECRAPELLPYNHEAVQSMRAALAGNENAAASIVDTGNANLDALLESVLRIDAERVKFLLADLLHRRLQKIQAHPQFMKTQTNRMSEHEVEFLKEYGSAVDRHFCTTVTDHFSKDVWKQLDAPDMMDEPDLDQFVFFKCLQGIAIDDNTDIDNPLNSQNRQPAGTCLIARYLRVRYLLLEGKIELL